MKNLQIAVAGVGLAAAMTANAAMLVDRGLPTANLNNAAGSDRSNVAWLFTGYTAADYWLVGDTFKNTSAQTWAIDTIRLWTMKTTDTAILWGGFDGSSIGVVSGAGTISAATYADSSTYQVPSGAFRSLHQVDFAVNITLAPGQIFNFFLDGTSSDSGYTLPFVHASNAALSGSTQDGSDGSMLYANVLGGTIALADIGTWDSNGDGWDKSSDVNLQVLGTAVPEPSTYIAAALLLLPFGASMFRKLRKTRTA
jgi:hypothetical protein